MTFLNTAIDFEVTAVKLDWEMDGIHAWQQSVFNIIGHMLYFQVVRPNRRDAIDRLKPFFLFDAEVYC